MTDILTRLRDATEGCRELDALIAAVTISHNTTFEDQTEFAKQFSGEAGAVGCSLSIPHYTTSIDAALTLVPEGWKPSLMSWGVEELTEPNDRVDIFMTLVSDDYKGHVKGTVKMTPGATPALALCIAALKARMAKEDAA